MSMTGLRAFDESLEQTHKWLNDLREQLGLEDRQQAYVILRSVLHTLRDRLTVVEAAQFAAQLPMLLQGVYYHEYKPADKPVKIRHKDQFLDSVAEKLARPFEPEQACRAAFAVFEKRMPGGEIDDVKRLLPDEIRELWP